ncbi:hypothetical protein BSM4216_0896 [Bacillus smithii]|nr:hypothetical protein BSM4216_0896 [Bacillus smithii]
MLHLISGGEWGIWLFLVRYHNQMRMAKISFILPLSRDILIVR